MPHIYSKSSFDRFGDDLCELVLSYLKFDEKFRYECVSKQFQRCVFEKQYKLYINKGCPMGDMEDTEPVPSMYMATKDAILAIFEPILKKCRNINRFIMDSNEMCPITGCSHSRTLMNLGYFADNAENILKLIIKYCNHLRYISLSFRRISFETMKAFFDKFGPTLQTIALTESKNFDKNYLKMCPNLRQFTICGITELPQLFDDWNVVMVKKLFELNLNYRNKDANRIGIIIESNKNSLRKVQIHSHNLVPIAVNNLLDHLPKLSQLRQLLIYSYKTSIRQSIANQLKQIGLKCKQLAIFRFDIVGPMSAKLFNNREVFESMKYFSRLTFLELDLLNGIESFSQISCDSLKESPNLKHLRLKANQLNDNFFIDIDKHLPKLEILEIFESDITDSALMSISKLSDIECIVFSRLEPTVGPRITESTICELIQKSRKLKLLHITNHRTLLDRNSAEISTYGNTVVVYCRKQLLSNKPFVFEI